MTNLRRYTYRFLLYHLIIDFKTKQQTNSFLLKYSKYILMDLVIIRRTVFYYITILLILKHYSNK